MSQLPFTMYIFQPILARPMGMMKVRMRLLLKVSQMTSENQGA